MSSGVRNHCIHGHRRDPHRQDALRSVSEDAASDDHEMTMAEKTFTLTEAQIKELTNSAYKEGLAKGIPPTDPGGTPEEAKEIQRRTLAELLGLTDPKKVE